MASEVNYHRALLHGASVASRDHLHHRCTSEASHHEQNSSDLCGSGVCRVAGGVVLCTVTTRSLWPLWGNEARYSRSVSEGPFLIISPSNDIYSAALVSSLTEALWVQMRSSVDTFQMRLHPVWTLWDVLFLPWILFPYSCSSFIVCRCLFWCNFYFWSDFEEEIEAAPNVTHPSFKDNNSQFWQLFYCENS